MKKNDLKKKLNSGKSAIGPFIGFPSPGLVEYMGWLGFDFVVIDCEHGPMDYETAENMIRAAELSNVTPILRIGLNEQQNIQRYLDAGASGVMIPLINNGDDAKKVVDSVKYPPIGKRGAFSGRSAEWGLQNMAEYIREANDETFISLQIETIEGVKNHKDIIGTDHADAIFLGPGDLSVNFGMPGDTMNPKVLDTIEELSVKIKATGKHTGTLGINVEQTSYWLERDINWIVSSDKKFIQAGVNSYMDAIKSQLKDTPSSF